MSALRYRVDSDSGCWIWKGYADRNGYGRHYNRTRRRVEWAHRYSYEIAKGPLLAGHEIDHTCQTTLCVNPAHLDQVTKLEHARRTMRRAGKDDRHLAAARLRRAGLTYTEIAEALNYSGGSSSAHQALQAAITKGLVAPDEIPEVRQLTDQEYEDIKLMYAFGIPQTAIGQFYNVHSSHVSRICSGKYGSQMSSGGAA